MALKDIFTMAKANKYTQDGREELIKAQEEIADDAAPEGTVRHWKDGDHVKQGGKWVPVKNAKSEAPEKGSKEDVKQRMKAYVDSMNKKNGEFAGRSKKLQKSMEKVYGKPYEPKAKTESKPAVVATKGLSPDQQKKMERLGFKAAGDSLVSESNGRKFEIKIRQQNNPYMSGPATQAKLYIDGKETPYEFGGGETLDPNSMVKIEKALKEQGYSKDAAPRVLTGDTKVKVRK